MARKFNNNEKLGVVRDILNGNADEIDQLKLSVDGKVTAVPGKGLSTNDYTNDDKAKLQALGTGTGQVDLSGYQAKEDGKGLVPLDDISKLSSLQPENFVLKDGTKVLSERNYTVDKDNKLGGIAFSATKNSSDASLRDRSTHTGVQVISTVTNLQTELNNRTPVVSTSPIKPTGIWYGTQAQYDAISSKVSTVKYEIIEA